MITVKLSEVHKDPKNVKLNDLYEININIEGKVSIHIYSTLYFDESFPIVEFAVVLNEWLKKPVGTNFKYESLDDEDLDTFDIIATNGNKYRFQSSWQESECIDLLTRDAVEKFIEAYTQQVKDAVLKQFGIDLRERIGL